MNCELITANRSFYSYSEKQLFKKVFLQKFISIEGRKAGKEEQTLSSLEVSIVPLKRRIMNYESSFPKYTAKVLD